MQEAFDQVSSTTLIKNFVILKELMKLVSNNNAQNDFKIPHYKKYQRFNKGESADDVYCAAEDVSGARNFLSNPYDFWI